VDWREQFGSDSVDDREESSGGTSPLSAGLAWASRITTLGIGFVVPILAGVWADNRLGTKPWLLLTGFALGLAVGFLQLLQIVRERGRRRS
jgi:F0F1-type ATP synthase assembly protein I